MDIFSSKYSNFVTVVSVAKFSSCPFDGATCWSGVRHCRRSSRQSSSSRWASLRKMAPPPPVERRLRRWVHFQRALGLPTIDKFVQSSVFTDCYYPANRTNYWRSVSQFSVFSTDGDEAVSFARVSPSCRPVSIIGRSLVTRGSFHNTDSFLCLSSKQTQYHDSPFPFEPRSNLCQRFSACRTISPIFLWYFHRF